jgi:hypothetical protein
MSYKQNTTDMIVSLGWSVRGAKMGSDTTYKASVSIYGSLAGLTGWTQPNIH